MIFHYEVRQSLTEVFSKKNVHFLVHFLEINNIPRVGKDSISFPNRQIIIIVNILNAIAHKAEH